MGKASLCIKMLEALYSRKIVTIAELADLLETNPRNIPEYKKELEAAGYYIESVPGRYGGYSLSKRSLFPSVKLTESEKRGLMKGYDYILARNDFLNKMEYSNAMAKISAATMSTEYANRTVVLNRFPLTMNQKELEKRYSAMSRCIESKNVIYIKYRSLSNEVTERNFHPYNLFMYNNAWFVIGFDELKKEILYFKLNRIESFNILERRFRVLITYNARDYLDEYGMKNYGEWYPIKLKTYGSYTLLANERIYGKNQKVEQIDENTAILSVEMQNKEEIISFVLKAGDQCEVLEPEWLKESVLEKVAKIRKMYDKN